MNIELAAGLLGGFALFAIIFTFAQRSLKSVLKYNPESPFKDEIKKKLMYNRLILGGIGLLLAIAYVLIEYFK